MKKVAIKKIKELLLFIDSRTFNIFFSFSADYLAWKRKKDLGWITNDQGLFEKSPDYKPSVYFLVPGVDISGGIAVIFQHANRLKKKGFYVKVLSLNNRNDSSWFPGQTVEILPFRKTKKILKGEEMDVLIATSYSTAFSVDMARARRKVYFVQSDESRFFPEEDGLCRIIKETYSLQMEYITEAKWIQKWLKEEYRHDAQYIPNGIDLDVFKKVKSLNSGNKPRVLIEGAINAPLKGMDDAYNAVKDLDCELWIVSNNGKPKKGWKYNKFFEKVPYGEMNKIYSSCDIFLKMSRVEGFFGPPLEAMACGCAVVVGKVTGYDEYIKDGYNALVVEQGDVEGAKKALLRLINEVGLRTKLIRNGYKTSKEWSWEVSCSHLVYFLLKN